MTGGFNGRPAYVRQAIERSLRKLSGELADVEGFLDPAQLQRFGPQLLGLPDYTYRSVAMRSDADGPTRPASALPLTGQQGPRLPQLWLDGRARCLPSTGAAASSCQ
jgi:hypothetical protein